MPYSKVKCKGMEAALMTSKHQITVPAVVRRKMNLRRGDRLLFEPAGDGTFVLHKAHGKKSDGAAVPFIKGSKKVLTQADMAAAIARGATESFSRRGG